MRWHFTAEQEALRQRIRDFLASGAPARDDLQYFRGRGGASREIYRAMGERGWLSLGWPVAFGGGGAGPSTEFVVWDEMAYARAVRPDLAAGIVARTLITHGTSEQRDRFLAGIARGEVGFALGYSEPEAGSDLAGVRTTATATADGYRVTGEKRWTSDAHNSSYLWLLCRTAGTPGDPGATSPCSSSTSPRPGSRSGRSGRSTVTGSTRCSSTTSPCRPGTGSVPKAGPGGSSARRSPSNGI